MKILSLSFCIGLSLWMIGCNNSDTTEDALEVEERERGATRQDNTREERNNSINFETQIDSNGNPSGSVKGDIDVE